jgi:hypothetical protein
MFLGDSLRKPYEGLDASRESGIAKSAGEQRAEAIGRVRNLSICLAAGFVFAAARRAIGVVNKYVIVAGRADHTVNRLAELLMAHLGCVLAACLFPAHGHRPPLQEYPYTDQNAVSELNPMLVSSVVRSNREQIPDRDRSAPGSGRERCCGGTSADRPKAGAL